MKKACLLFLFSLISIIHLPAQEQLDSHLLQEDLTTLGEIIIGLSPKLTKEDRRRIDSLIQAKKAELEGEDLTTMAFFNFLSKIDFQTKFDEHASLSLTEEVIMPFLTNSKLFPLPIKLIESSMVVNAIGSEVPYGSKIRTINGVRPFALISSFTRDRNDTFIRRSLEGQFSMMYLIKEGSFDEFKVAYTTPSDPNTIIEKSIAGIDFQTYVDVFSESIFPLGFDKLRNLINTHFYEDTKTYYLQLNSFNWDSSIKKGLLHFLNANHKNFDKKFNEIFKEIADSNAENLIIDLRFNRGGNVKVPGVLYSYLAQDSFTEDIRITIQDFDIPHMSRVRKISGEAIQNSRDVEKFIKQYKKQFVADDSVYVWNLVDQEEIQPKSNRFGGNVYLLVGGRSISAAAYFAALFKSHERGLIVGEEMGGSYRSLSAGQILTYEIPNTKLELETPIMVVDFSDQLFEKIQQDKIKPDIAFSEEERYNYFIKQKDIELEETLKHIENRK